MRLELQVEAEVRPEPERPALEPYPQEGPVWPAMAAMVGALAAVALVVVALAREPWL